MKRQIVLLVGIFILTVSNGQTHCESCFIDTREKSEGIVLASAAFAGSDRETDRLLKAKGYVFRGDWEKAKNRLDSYLQAYPSGNYRDEALYWLAQSLNKLSSREKQLFKVITLKEEAIKNLNLLLVQYPKSIWVDDAKTLKIEICGELVLMGKKEYKKYVEEIITTQEKNESDLKIVALNTLIELEPEAAIPILETIIRNEEDPAVRKKGVFLLSRHYPEEAVDILNLVKIEDPDATVKEEASYWLEQNRIRMIPVQLIYYGYCAEVQDPEEQKRITENKVSMFDLHRLGSSSKKKAEKAIKQFFDEKLLNVLFVTNGVRGLNYDYFSTKISHRINGFRIQVLDEEIVKEYDQISGRVRFYDLVEEKEYDISYTVDESSDKLLAIRKGDDVALLVLRFESYEEEVELKDEPVYNTEFSDVLGCVVYSSRQSWSLKEMIRQNGVTEYGRSKVLIPGEKGRWVLVGSVLLNWKGRKFIGRNAELLDPKGNVMAKAAQIVVPVDDPAGFEMVGKRER